MKIIIAQMQNWCINAYQLLMCEFLVVCFSVFIQCVCDAFAFAMVYFLLGEVAVDLDVTTCHLANKQNLI